MSYEITYKHADRSKEDIDIAVEFMKKLCVYQKMDDSSMINEENMVKLLAEGAGKGLIAFVDDKPVAYMYYYYNYPMLIGTKCIYIDCLYIEEEYRHLGIGTQILKYVANMALDEGCRRLEWMCLTWNKPALDMYDKLGAQKMDNISLHRVYYDNLVKLAGR